MKATFLPRSRDTTLTASARLVAAKLPLPVVAAIANDHPGEAIDGPTFTHLAAARHTCIRCGRAPAAGRVGLSWLCQGCKEKSDDHPHLGDH